MFQTALPFGYLIQFLVLAGLGVLACGLLLRGWLRRDQASLRTGAVVAAVLVGVEVLAAAQPSIDEWNPHPVDPGALLGRWVDGGRTLELRADSTFILREPRSPAVTGHYDNDDWGLRLLNEEGRPLGLDLRVVAADGEYRIIHDPIDPDAWDGSFHFRHVPPARVR